MRPEVRVVGGLRENWIGSCTCLPHFFVLDRFNLLLIYIRCVPGKESAFINPSPVWLKGLEGPCRGVRICFLALNELELWIRVVDLVGLVVGPFLMVMWLLNGKFTWIKLLFNRFFFGIIRVFMMRDLPLGSPIGSDVGNLRRMTVPSAASSDLSQVLGDDLLVQARIVDDLGLAIAIGANLSNSHIWCIMFVSFV